jgi:ABC-type Fe3+-hydroxamate transport system substrate-binding protein
MNKNRIIVTAVAVLFLAGAAAVFLADSGDTDISDAALGDPGDPYLSITNSIGTTVSFYGPAQKVASLGLSFSTTLLSLGCIDDIVMTDNYSATSSSGVSELEDVPFYPVGDGQVIAQLLANGLGGFDKDRDVVFLYGYSYHATAIQSMETFGIKVVTFYPQTYEMGMDMVTFIGKIMGLDKEAKEMTDKMRAALSYYSETLADHGISDASRIKAVYVSYSGGTLRVGNVNSYSVILMKIAGGSNSADNSTMTGSALTSYQVDPTMFIQLKLDVIFLDPYYSGTPDEFRTEMNIGPDVRIYKLDMVMNQYGPTSLDGIEFMAMAMYPYIFGYLDYEESVGGTDDTLIYIAAGGAAVAALSIAYIVFRP